MKFSQRTGKAPVRTIIQIDDIDEPLKVRLWNIIQEYFLNVLPVYYDGYSSAPYIIDFFRLFWIDFKNELITDLPNSQQNTYVIILYLKEWFFKAKWYEIYDFVEFVVKISHNPLNFDINERLNNALKNELSGYTIINDQIIQITSEEEIKEIEEGISGTTQWKSVNTHLTTSLNYLADRTNPNYRNSIKESISAVEAMCVIITNDSKATLGKALGIIDKKYVLHKALKESFSSLYGYTSDASGIRHSLTETDATVDFEEAKFMLTTCSAFINFLKSKYIL